MKYIKYVLAFIIVKQLLLFTISDKYFDLVISAFATQLLFLILIVFCLLVIRKILRKSIFK